MKVSLDWLKEFVDVPWDLQTLSKRFTMAGFEVESIEKKNSHTTLDLNVTPNRGDCLCISGLAREIAALQGKKFILKERKTPKGKRKIKEFLQVQVLDSKSAPRYMARVIRGVRIGSSPDWLVRRLESIGLRSINNVVDCTNYVMWELGHPLHAFDLQLLEGQKIVVQKERENHFQALDGNRYLCSSDDLFICDAKKPVALAGVMGGLNSEVSETTNDVVIEAAYFEPKGIHKTSKRLKLVTESSFRFERGVDPNGVARACHRVVELIIATAGGTPTEDWVDIYPKKIAPKWISFPFTEVSRILGVDFSPSFVKRLFETLGLVVEGQTQARWRVKIPTYRTDLLLPIDLVEEVARMGGFEKIPSTLPKVTLKAPVFEKRRKQKEEAVSQLRGFGFSESFGLSFCALKEATRFLSEEEIVFLDNPLSEEQSVLRPSLIPGLLKGLAFNWHRNRKNIKLFEFKPTFQWKNGEIFEDGKLGVVATGNLWPLQWAMKPKPVDYYLLKGLLSRLSVSLRLPSFQWSDENIPSFLSASQSSRIFLKGEEVGWLGLVHPDTLKAWDVDGFVYAMELRWDLLVRFSEAFQSLKEISKYPFIERDLALVVEKDLAAEKVEEMIQKFQNPWIQKIQFFDVFKGGTIPPNKKSIALNIVYSSLERTLTNEEVGESHEALVAYLTKNLGATLR